MAEQKPLVWSGTNRTQLSAADTIPLSAVPVMVASGPSGSKGLAPSPGTVTGTTRFLREDGSWVVPPAGGGATDPHFFLLMGA